MKPRKVGVYIPADIEIIMEKMLKEKKVRNISQVIQEALRSYLSEELSLECQVAGFINILYNHEVGRIDEELTDIQHGYLDVVMSSNHMHVDKERCLLSIAVKGHGSRIKELISKLRFLRGVLLVKPTLICLEV
ncbi:MAG: CopG family transcriptional regulator [Desulfurococcaceae archaeon]